MARKMYRNVLYWYKYCIDIEMYSTHNEGKSFITKRFVRTLKNNFINTWIQYKKKFCIDKLDNIVDKYNNTYHSTIKMKPVDIKPRTYIDSSK